MKDNKDWFTAWLMSDAGICFKDPNRVFNEPERIDPYNEESMTRHDEIKKADLQDFLTIYFPLLFT